ncbi:hypothetical protein V2O64_24635 (plasmid) [Verrucomicrobiaceae bacterium 227]
MIYLTQEQITNYYGKKKNSTSSGKFNAEKRSEHSDDAYNYEFGYYDGHCIYAIIEKTLGATGSSQITLEEAEGLRSLNGNGDWKLNTPWDPEKNADKIAALIAKKSNILGYFYKPDDSKEFKADIFKSKLICVHQQGRKQLVIYHPKWRPNLAGISAGS